MAYDDRDDVVVVERGGTGQVVAFLIGLTIGAGAALLLAPQSGAEGGGARGAGRGGSGQ